MWVMRHLLKSSTLQFVSCHLKMPCSVAFVWNFGHTISDLSWIPPTKPPPRGGKSWFFGKTHGKDSISLPSGQPWVSCQVLRGIVWSANPTVLSRTERKLSWPTDERVWLGFVLKKAAQERSPRSSPESLTRTYRIGLIEMAVGSVYLGLVV